MRFRNLATMIAKHDDFPKQPLEPWHLMSQTLRHGKQGSCGEENCLGGPFTAQMTTELLFSQDLSVQRQFRR
jgi:hypothetical protein